MMRVGLIWPYLATQTGGFDWSSALSRSSVITFNSRVMAGAAPPPIVVWPSPFRTAVSLKKSSTAACFGPMPDWPRHFFVSAVYTAPHGTILPFQSRIPAAAGGSAIAHWQQAALIVALSL